MFFPMLSEILESGSLRNCNPDLFQISILKYSLKNLLMALGIQMLQIEGHWDERIFEVSSNDKVPYKLHL